MRTFAFIAVMLLLTMRAYSQDDAQTELQRHTWDVYTRRNAVNAAQTDIIFIDLLSGDQSTLNTTGERFTLVDNGVIFYDRVERRVKLGKADGVIRDHPFIILTSEAHQVDWTVSADKDRIVWSVSRRVEDNQLITATWLADVAGTEIRELLVYGPRDGIFLSPIGFGKGRYEVFMEAQVHGSEALSPYTLRTGLFALELAEDELVTRALPGDPSCFCAVGFGANLMLNLAPLRELSGLDVEIYSLEGGERQVIPALSRGNYSAGGNILVSADGEQAVYALSQVGERGEIRSVLALVDIENGRQRIASSPISGTIRPLRFSEENRMALIAIGEQDVTLKVDLIEGGHIKVADAIYLGQIGDH